MNGIRLSFSSHSKDSILCNFSHLHTYTNKLLLLRINACESCCCFQFPYISLFPWNAFASIHLISSGWAGNPLSLSCCSTKGAEGASTPHSFSLAERQSNGHRVGNKIFTSAMQNILMTSVWVGLAMRLLNFCQGNGRARFILCGCLNSFRMKVKFCIDHLAVSKL